MIKALVQKFLDERGGRVLEEEVIGQLRLRIWKTRNLILEDIAKEREFRRERPLNRQAFWHTPTRDTRNLLISLIEKGEVSIKQESELTAADLNLALRSASDAQVTETLTKGGLPFYQLRNDERGRRRRDKVREEEGELVPLRVRRR